jgi:AcrR family transcriptional regulator
MKTTSTRTPVSRSRHKGLQTRTSILDIALGLASRYGLEGLSIGVLAEAMHMSKSGVFAHFGSREELQIAVIRHYFSHFEHGVFRPALQQPRGLPRVRALFANWMQQVGREIESGCIFISGAVDFDDRPGAVRDALAQSMQTWLAALHRAIVQAQECGHLRPEADAQQIAFEIHGLILALHYEARFLKNPDAIQRSHRGFETIVSSHSLLQESKE